MTTGATPDAGGRDPVGRQHNGLAAASYVPLTDVDAELGRRLLAVLARARIAAYLDPVPAAPRRRLFVAADERGDARTIVTAAMRGLPSGPEGAPGPPDPLAGVDTDSEFAALTADWHVDTLAAVREAERQLRSEDAEWRARLAKPPADDPVWLDEDHYVPPAPPPLPRLAAPTIMAMAVIAVSILLLGLGGQFGLASDLTLLLGVLGLLLGAWILVMRLRARHEDSGDDGAVV